LHTLQTLGPVAPSPYHNVLVMQAEDPLTLLDAVERATEENPALNDAVSRVAPSMRTFDFHLADEFREKADSVLLAWSQDIGGRLFHVRLHRRGAGHNLSTPEIEKFLDDAALTAAHETGMPAKLSFTDPDIVIAVDTIDDRTGMGLWTRGDLARHRLLRPD
jgi:tRNA(Ser,Leu) C12 N-acetylase TAN1